MASPLLITTDVINRAGGISRASFARNVRLLADAVWTKAGNGDKRAGFSCILTDDIHVQQLNLDFRGANKPTNVLSFPSDEPQYLGDIIIAAETVAREAKEQGKTRDEHLAHMIVHGLLHLLGHDHVETSQAENMEAIEIDILQSFGIKHPYLL